MLINQSCYLVQNAYVEQWKKEVSAEEEKELMKKAEEKVRLITKNNQGILFMLYKENISEKMISMAKSLYHLEAMVDNFNI